MIMTYQRKEMGDFYHVGKQLVKQSGVPRGVRVISAVTIMSSVNKKIEAMLVK